MDVTLCAGEGIADFVWEAVTVKITMNAHECTVWWSTISSCCNNHESTSIKPRDSFPELVEKVVTGDWNWVYGNWRRMNKPRTIITGMVFAKLWVGASDASDCLNSTRRLFMLPRSVKPRKPPVCLSYTNPSRICISSMITATHFWYSAKEEMSAASISCWSTSSENQIIIVGVVAQSALGRK